MTPQQQVLVGCKQIGECAVRLRGWVEAHSETLNSLGPMLRRDVAATERAAQNIAKAIHTAPALGIAGQPLMHRLTVLAQVLGDDSERLPVETGDGSRISGLGEWLPEPALMSCSLSLKTKNGRKMRDGMAFTASVLDRPDLIKILGRAFAIGGCALDDGNDSLQRVRSKLAAARQSQHVNMSPGLAAADVREIVAYYEIRGLSSRLPQCLATEGFWTQLPELLPYISQEERSALLSELWGNDAALSRIYENCSRVLDSMGGSLPVYLPRDALFSSGAGPAAEQLHRTAVINRQTMLGLLEPIGETVSVTSSYGVSQSVSKPALATLLRDIQVERVPSASTSAPFDIILFPHPGTIRGQVYCNGGPSAGSCTGETLVDLVAHVKALYLMEQSVEARAFCTLAVCSAGQDASNDCLSETLADWVDASQGAEPHLRERSLTSLYVSLPSGAPAANGSLTDWIDELAPEQVWPHEWFPGRPFQNVFAVSTGHEGSHLSTSGLPSTRHAWQVLRELSDQDLGPRPSRVMAQQICNGTTAWVKARQLQRNVIDLRQRLRSRFLRLLTSDPLQISEWRRQIAQVALNRLEDCGRRNVLRILLSALLPADEKLERAIRMVCERQAALYVSKQLDSAPGMAPDATPVAHRPAAANIVGAVIDCWTAGVRQGAGSSALARRLGIPAHIVLHIADEVILGAERIGMRTELESRIESILSRSAGGEAAAMQSAAMCGIYICSYVESLQAPRPLFETTQRLLGSASYAGALPQRGADGSEWAIRDRWPRAFLSLVDDNVAASLSAAPTGGDRMLHQILSELNASIEVES